MGVPRDRRSNSDPDRDGPVASFQRPEKAGHTPEGIRASWKNSSLISGKGKGEGETRMNTITTHYIDGSFVESHGREVMDIIKPTNGGVIARVASRWNWAAS